jgi:hypothetical protein
MIWLDKWRMQQWLFLLTLTTLAVTWCGVAKRAEPAVPAPLATIKCSCEVARTPAP